MSASGESWRRDKVQRRQRLCWATEILSMSYKYSRRIKRFTWPMLGFKNFHAAQRTLAGMEVMAMIKKGQIETSAGEAPSPAERFYTLAA